MPAHSDVRDREVVPKEVRHDWVSDPEQKGLYTCSICKAWTANFPLYRYALCSAKDRRQGLEDRRE